MGILEKPSILKKLSDIDTSLGEIVTNVKSFGAKGNANYLNATDGKWYQDSGYTILSQDDTPFIQNAINYLISLGKGTLYFPKGTYLVKLQSIPTTYANGATCLNILGNNITLKGDKYNSIIKQVSYNMLNNQTDVLWVQGKYMRGHMFRLGDTSCKSVNNIILEDLVLDGGCPDAPASPATWDGVTDGWDITHKGIYYSNAGIDDAGIGINNIEIKNCELRNFRGEVIYGGGTYAKNINIMDNYIHDSVTGISCDGRLTIKNNLLDNISFNCIECMNMLDADYIDNKFYNSYNGIALNTSVNSGVSVNPHSMVSRNVFRNIANYGINLATPYNTDVINNILSDCYYGIYITKNADKKLANTNIKNNQIICDTVAGYYGMYISDWAADSSITIKDNEFIRSYYAIANSLDFVYQFVIGSINYKNSNVIIKNNKFVTYPIEEFVSLTPNSNKTLYHKKAIVTLANALITPNNYYFSSPIKITVRAKINNSDTATARVTYYNDSDSSTTSDTALSTGYSETIIILSNLRYGSNSRYISLNILSGSSASNIEFAYAKIEPLFDFRY